MQPRSIPTGAAGQRNGEHNRQQHGAGFLGRPVRGITLRAEHGQHRQLGEGLGIREVRGHPVHPDVAGPPLAARWERHLAIDGVDQGAAFTRHEPLGYLDNAEDLSQVRLGLGRLDDRLGHPAATGHPDHDLPGAQRPRREQGAAQDEIGRPEQQHLVLGAARLTLGAIDQDHRPALAGRGRLHDRPDLAADRESRAAPATQIDAFRHLDQLPGSHPAHRAENLLVRGQVDAVVPVQARGKPGAAYPHRLRGGLLPHERAS